MPPLLRLLLPLLVSASSHAGDELIAITPEKAARTEIATAVVADLKGDGGIRLPAQVVVPPAGTEVIAAPLPAMVANVRVAYGESVKKGQVLARLQGAQLLELQREFATARTQAELAAQNLRRDESLHADGIIARGRLDTTRATERTAALQLAEKREALRLAGVAEPAGNAGSMGATGNGAPTLSGGAEIRAPFDGVILEAKAQPGQRVEAATPLFILGRLAPLWLEIQATPALAADIAPGDSVSVANCASPARVTLVAPQMQAASQSLLIRAEVADPRGCVRPFQYVQATIVAASRAAAGTWRLPPRAVIRHQGQTWVFVETKGGFKPTAVKVVAESPDVVLVAADLAKDARVVIRGASVLKAAWLGLGAGEAE